MGAGTGDVTRRFVDFVTDVKPHDLPQGASLAIKRMTLDTIAVILAGLDEAGPRHLLDHLRAGGEPSGPSTLLGTGVTADATSAALFNATAGHALDYDDYCFGFSGHPSVVMVPALLALAEQRGATGEELITAYATGFEAAIMLSRAVNPRHYSFGWHGTGTIGTMATTFACAKLLDLGPEQTRNATALGASFCSGLRQNFGTDVKPLHAGNASRAGLMAAELAERGFEGDAEILEGRLGFLRVFSPDTFPDDADLSAVGQHKDWKLVTPGIVTKLFAACGSSHTAIGGAMQLREQGITGDDVERLDVYVTDVQAGNLQYSRPQTALEGKFSMQYTVARALQGGSLGMEDFTDSMVRAPDVTSLMDRILMHVDDQLTSDYVWGDHRPAILDVQLTSGERRRLRTDAPPGSPGTFTDEMLMTKVRECFRHGRILVDADELARVVMDLENVDDLRAVTSLVAQRDSADTR